MALSIGTNTYNRKNWESTDFPILCETCLGNNPYLRMQKEKYGDECRICSRPYTVFRWCPGKGSRYKRTEICQTCSKLKNVCQTCVFDLSYGLPVQVRDQAMGVKEEVPNDPTNMEYQAQLRSREMEIAGSSHSSPYEGALSLGAGGGKANPAAHSMLQRIARTNPYYKRNAPHICSFWVKGECKRGEECPYRHERPTDPDDPLSKQNITDRYHGIDDPVAEKILTKVKEMPQLKPPDDKTITTLYIGGITQEMSENDLKNHFYQFGEIRQIHMAYKNCCAFVEFTTREASELAALNSFNKLNMKGRRLNVRWGRSQSQQSASIYVQSVGSELTPDHFMPVPGLPGTLPAPEIPEGEFPAPPPLAAGLVPKASYGATSSSSAQDSESRTPMKGFYYPSMDPSRLGAVPLEAPPPEPKIK